jgi:hypothetical protein
MNTPDKDRLTQYGLDAFGPRRTTKDVAAKRTSMVNQQHAAKLIELGLVEMREIFFTSAGQNIVWK